jgi:hypothetical protein
VQAGSVSYGKATPYLPVIDLLKGYFQIEAQDDHRRLHEKVTGKLLTLDEALKPAVPALLALLDVSVDDAAWSALDPPQRRQRTLEAVKRVLLRESQVQPVLVAFEVVMTMGIVPVAALAGRVADGPAVTMTSTLRRTSSGASEGRRSSCPSADRHSMRMAFPSTYPISRRPCRNASVRADITDKGTAVRNPIRGMFDGDCALTASGGEEGQGQCDQRQDSHHGSTPPSSASAFSSQNPMSISRYIVIAVATESSLFARSPVRRYSLPRPR